MEKTLKLCGVVISLYFISLKAYGLRHVEEYKFMGLLEPAFGGLCVREICLGEIEKRN